MAFYGALFAARTDVDVTTSTAQRETVTRRGRHQVDVIRTPTPRSTASSSDTATMVNITGGDQLTYRAVTASSS